MAKRIPDPTKLIGNLDPAPMEKERARKHKTFRIRPEAIRQFAILAKELEMKEQDLVAEALNMLFEKHGKDLVA